MFDVNIDFIQYNYAACCKRNYICVVYNYNLPNN